MSGEGILPRPRERRAWPAAELPALVRRAADGDQAAWDGLVDRFSALLWSICRSHRLGDADAADVVQQTWLHLLERLHTIEDPSRLSSWLATTCRRECLAVLRRGRRTAPVPDERMVHLPADAGAGAERRSLITDRDAALWRAFSRLSERCQALLRLLVVTPEDGPPSYQAVAAALGVPVGSLGPNRGRCLAQLRKLLDIEGIYDAAADS